VGGVDAFLVGVPLMRLSGLAAGIATFAVLEITHNVLRNWPKIGPGAKTLPLVPETSGFLQVTVGAVAVAGIAFAYQRSRPGRLLRAAREDPAAAQGSGVNIHRQRLLAFTLSGALAGFGGGLLVHLLGSITTEQVYLDLAFITLAMLIVGGVSSLWGAVVGALFVSGLNSFLAEAEKGVGGVDLPTGTRLVTLGFLMALVLLFRPAGITGGRELKLGKVLAHLPEKSRRERAA
jgi:branched-chain amino acid transport system permease protein